MVCEAVPQRLVGQASLKPAMYAQLMMPSAISRTRDDRLRYGRSRSRTWGNDSSRRGSATFQPC